MAVKLYLTGVQKIIRGFIMSKIYSLEDAKKLISDFVEKEYGNEKVDFSDLSSIDVLTQLQMMNCTMYKQK